MANILSTSTIMAKKGEKLDLTSPPEPKSGNSAGSDSGVNPFLGVHFACCDVYSRVYANQQRSAYVGHCPHCAKRVQFQVGAGGSESRFFSVS